MPDVIRKDLQAKEKITLKAKESRRAKENDDAGEDDGRYQNTPQLRG